MLKTFYLPVVQLKRLPPLFGLSFGAFLGLALTALVLGGRSEQQKTQLLDEYGTTLAELIAGEAVGAALERDLISLHAIIQTATNQQRVAMVTVHDVDASLLAQSGRLPPGVSSQPYLAVIPLQDGKVGQVTVTLRTSFGGEAATRWTLFGTCLLLLLMAALSLYECYGDVWYVRAEHWVRKSASSPTDEEEWTEEGEQIEEGQPDDTLSVEVEALPEAPPTPDLLDQSDLVLALPNRNRLQRQLSDAMFQQLISDFEGVVDEVLAIYGGTKLGQVNEQGVYCLRFKSVEGASEAAFRALCCAYLVQGLTSYGKIRLQFLAEVCRCESDLKIAIGNTGIFLHKTVLDDYLEQRIETEPEGEFRLRLTGFKPPFAALLQSQQQQLNQPVGAG